VLASGHDKLILNLIRNSKNESKAHIKIKSINIQNKPMFYFSTTEIKRQAEKRGEEIQ